MNELPNLLQKLLSDVFGFYYKAHAFHWNVEGPLFTMYHDFFGEIYKDVHASVDEIAERIRVLRLKAPISLVEIYAKKTTPDALESVIGDTTARSMLVELKLDNEVILRDLQEVFTAASALNKQGLADYIAGRIDQHEMLEWKLSSHLK